MLTCPHCGKPGISAMRKLFLPYSPGLNPIERLWHWLREHQLSNRIYSDYDDLFESGCRAWNTLTPERLKTVCATSWVERTN